LPPHPLAVVLLFAILVLVGPHQGLGNNLTLGYHRRVRLDLDLTTHDGEPISLAPTLAQNHGTVWLPFRGSW